MQIANPCLLIINIQVDFASPDGFAAKLGRKLDPIQEILPRLRLFYRQLKALAVPVIFLQYVARKDLSPVNIRINKDREEKARICLLNSRGANLYYFKPGETDLVLQQRYYDAFAQSRLTLCLQKRNIKTLIVTGIRSELSVDATAKRAINEGYEVIVAKDLIATYQERSAAQKHFLEIFDRYYGYAMDSAAIIDNLQDR